MVILPERTKKRRFFQKEPAAGSVRPRSGSVHSGCSPELLLRFFQIFQHQRIFHAFIPTSSSSLHDNKPVYRLQQQSMVKRLIGADHFALIHSCPPDVKSWTTFFTNVYFRRAATSRRKSLIFLDIPPFFSLAVYFFALIFIFTADDLGSSPFSIIKEYAGSPSYLLILFSALSAFAVVG